MGIDMSTMQQNLQSLQSAISMSTMKRAMNMDKSAMATLLSDMQTSNPPVSLQGHGDILDMRA